MFPTICDILMKIVLFAAPGIMGPHVFLSLLQRKTESIALLVLSSKPHAISNDELIAIARHGRVPYVAPHDVTNPQFVQTIRDLQPDIILVASFDMKIPQEIIDIPRCAALNLHPALLPKYRGACPEFWAIRNGEKTTGVSLHYLTDTFDAGDILFQEEVSISPYETLGSLLYKMGSMSVKVFIRFLDAYERAEPCVPIQQDPKQVTYARLVTAEDMHIQWHTTSQDIVNLVRAANPLGGAWTSFRGFHLKVWHASVFNPDTISLRVPLPEVQSLLVLADEKKLLVKTGDGFIEVNAVQHSLAYIIDGWNFVCAAEIQTGEKLS